MLDRVKTREREGGFTIIEVLIVLAIAGLIMVVVFLAVPNLQRSQRNNSRKTDANNVLSAIGDYVSNNSGALPAAACTGSGCSFMTNVNLGYFTLNATNVTYTPAPATGSFTAPKTGPTSEQMFIYGGATCQGAANPPVAGTSNRQVAIWYGIEGSVGTQCISD